MLVAERALAREVPGAALNRNALLVLVEVALEHCLLLALGVLADAQIVGRQLVSAVFQFVRVFLAGGIQIGNNSLTVVDSQVVLKSIFKEVVSLVHLFIVFVLHAPDHLLCE